MSWGRVMEAGRLRGLGKGLAGRSGEGGARLERTSEGNGEEEGRETWKAEGIVGRRSDGK